MKRFTCFFAAVLAAMICLPAFAEGVDMTSRLVNPDFNLKFVGWTVSATSDALEMGSMLKPDSQSEENTPGYWGFNGACVRYFTYDTNRQAPAGFYQIVKGLKNGTYVFSMWVEATLTSGDASDENYAAGTKGVSLFANDAQLNLTLTPAEKFAEKRPWCHATKFSVPVIVTDGTLKVGLSMANLHSVRTLHADNCSLFYYGDVTTDEALFEVAKADMADAFAKADAVKDAFMSAESTMALEEAYQKAQAAQTYDEYVTASMALCEAATSASISVENFSALPSLVAAAKEIANGEWSENVTEQVANLKNEIKKVENRIEVRNISATGLESVMTGLTEAMDLVRVDELMDKLDELQRFLLGDASESDPCFGVTRHPGFGEEIGQYPEVQEAILQQLYEDGNTLFDNIQEGLNTASEGFAYVSVIDQAANKCINSANRDFSFPLSLIIVPDQADPTSPYQVKDAENILDDEYVNSYYAEKMYCNAEYEVMRVSTPIIHSDVPIAQLSINVVHTLIDKFLAENDGPSFNITEFYLLDEDGNRVSMKNTKYYSMNPADNDSFDMSYIYDSKAKTGKQKYHVASNMNASKAQAGRGNHCLTVTFPSAMTDFQLMFEVSWDAAYLGNMPTELYITARNEIQSNLANMISTISSKTLRPWGLQPGFYNVDYTPLAEALAAGQAVLDNEGSNDDCVDAAAAIQMASDNYFNTPMNQPVDGGEYYIASRGAYVTNQGIQKVITLCEDSIIWYDTADPNDDKQRWIFHSVEPDDPSWPYEYFTIQNKATGKYISYATDEYAYELTGEEIDWGNHWRCNCSAEDAGKFYFEDITVKWNKGVAYGQIIIEQTDPNALDDPWGWACGQWNSGKYDGSRGDRGSSSINPGRNIKGVNGSITHYIADSPNSNSDFAIIPNMLSYPYTTELSAFDGTFDYHFAKASKYFSFTADKACTFENFKVYDECHKELSATYKVLPGCIQVTFTKYVADFYFSFDNNEGVKSVVINTFDPSGAKSPLELLEMAYNEAYCEYLEGTEIGCIKDLTAYNAAIATAEDLLENGATDEQATAAIKALEDAVAGLEPVQPVAGKIYVIYSAAEYFADTYGIDAGLCYHSTGNPAWMPLDANAQSFQWLFEQGEEENTFYLKNMGTGSYLGEADMIGGHVPFSTTPVPYEIVVDANGKFRIHCTNGGEGSVLGITNNNEMALAGDVTFPSWAGSYILWQMKEVSEYTGIEDVIVAESETPAVVNGVFDLTGRRVAAPGKGLYIINGKKVLVK